MKEDKFLSVKPSVELSPGITGNIPACACQTESRLPTLCLWRSIKIRKLVSNENL